MRNDTPSELVVPPSERVVPPSERVVPPSERVVQGVTGAGSVNVKLSFFARYRFDLLAGASVESFASLFDTAQC